MPLSASPFAICKPALGRQKDENENNNAQDVPLPGVSGVIPKKHLLEQVQQIQTDPGDINDRFSNSQATKQF